MKRRTLQRPTLSHSEPWCTRLATGEERPTLADHGTALHSLTRRGEPVSHRPLARLPTSSQASTRGAKGKRPTRCRLCRILFHHQAHIPQQRTTSRPSRRRNGTRPSRLGRPTSPPPSCRRDSRSLDSAALHKTTMKRGRDRPRSRGPLQSRSSLVEGESRLPRRQSRDMLPMDPGQNSTGA